MRDRSRLIRTASFIALAGNLALGAFKIAGGLLGGSLAVLGDGIDSLVDIGIALMALVVSNVVSRPADRGHPWGHGRAETVATALLAFLLFFAGAQLILNSIGRLIAGEESGPPGPLAVAAALVSVAGKSLLAIIQYRFGKKADSPMLRANAKNMGADVILSAGVLVGLAFSIGSGAAAADSVTAILVGLWVIRSSAGIFIETNLELMDGGVGADVYEMVFGAVHSVKGAGNPHRTRIRRIAGLWDIDIDIEVDAELRVSAAHQIATQVEEAIKARVDGIYDIVVHIEPTGDRRQGEGYGLSEKEIRG
jgi:cation diffusion facilitator family transporter